MSEENYTEKRFLRLQNYLREGWIIAPPVYRRPVWHTLKVQREAYHFVLRRGDQTNLLVVPASPHVERFIRDKQLQKNLL